MCLVLTYWFIYSFSSPSSLWAPGGWQETLPEPNISYCCCLVTKSCPSLCDPKDCSPLGSSVHGILQARILEWVAVHFSRGSSWPRNQTLGLGLILHLVMQKAWHSYQTGQKVKHKIFHYKVYIKVAKYFKSHTSTFGRYEQMCFLFISCIAGRFFTFWATRLHTCFLLSPSIPF